MVTQNLLEKNKKSLRKILDPIKKSPLMSMLSPVRFEMKSNREVIVEGCKNIAEYDENVVRVNVKKMLVSFFGRNLKIKCLTPDSLIIEGFITSIEFMT